MEILYSVEEIKYRFGFSNTGLIFVITGVLALAAAIFLLRNHPCNGEDLLFFTSFVCIAVGIVCFVFAKPEHDYTRYYATIEDSTPVSEVLEKYEILDVHGKIYELREREDTNGND